MSEVLPNSRNHDKTRDRWSDQNSRQCKVVYFLAIDWLGDSPLVTIGYSSDFSQRLLQHTADKFGRTIPVDVLAVVKASRSDESALHRHFSEWHYGGSEKELFTPSSDLVGYVRWLRNQWCAWVPDDEWYERGHDVPPADYSQWGPGSGRELHVESSGLLFSGDAMWFPPREVTGDDFYTHHEIIECARRTMGGIDLDPASHPVANQVVKASKIYTLNNSGLDRKWSGRVWLNPPFSQWSEWAGKVDVEWNSGRLNAMCVLGATRTITAKYFAPVRDQCRAACVQNGRIPFWGPKAGTPDDGHAIFYFGDDGEAFTREFRKIGTVFVNAEAMELLEV